MKLISVGLLLLGVGILAAISWPTTKVSADDDEPRRVEADDEESFDDEEPEGEEGEDDEGLAEYRAELVEEARELAAEIEEVRDEEPEFARRLAERRRAVQAQVERLDRAIELERQLEKAEADRDFDRAGELEEQLGTAHLEIEFADRLGELTHAVGELDDIVGDDEWPESDRDRARTLAGAGRKLVESTRELKRAFEQDDEDRIERLEEQLEREGDRFHLQFAEFELGHALREARLDGDEEGVREIEEELREIRAELSGEPREDLDDPRGEPEQPPEVPRAEPLPEVDASQLDYEQDVRLVLQRFCFGCHGPDAQEADLNVAVLLDAKPLVRNRRAWLHVREHVRTGVMPPTGEDAPSPVQRAGLVAWIGREIVDFDYSTIRHPGLEPTRRLSNREYDNTVRDLFGIDVRPASRFPADASTRDGFDNSANTLFLQPLVLERFFGAAEEVVDAALPSKGDVRSPVLRDVVRRLDRLASGDEETDVLRAFLGRFLVRAHRRPVGDEQLTASVRVYSEARKAGRSTRQSLRRVLGVVLVSPSFLMHVETPPKGNEDHRVSGWDLASRLSYFLWASMPDDRLFELAEAGRLSDPKVLGAEVDRMLEDPRSDSLGTVFASQWLGYEHVGTRVRLDPIDNPWCTDTLMAAMREESSRFFVSLFRDDQPLERLVDADYTFVNEELARHYGIPGVRGEELRRVKVDTTRRGGILGHASVLAATSFPDRTSPVNRGRWILADLLGTPPPPPPPNVSEFDEEVEERDSLTLRRKLELHRRKPQCASCHDQIDPLGLSLENYGRFGRFRTRSEGGRVDATGTLPDGTRFRGLPGLREVLIERRMDDLTTQLTRRMLAYALGRQLEYFDESAVQSIVADVEANGRRSRALVHAIAASYPFQYERRPSERESDQ